MTFLDSSVPARVLVSDVGSDDVRELFESDTALFGSSLLIGELLRVATRRGLAHETAEWLIQRMRLLAVDDSLLREAGRLDTPGTWVRTADAIHLVSANRLEQTTFLTYDRVQARGAEALGLQVQSPGLAENWWR